MENLSLNPSEGMKRRLGNKHRLLACQQQLAPPLLSNHFLPSSYHLTPEPHLASSNPNARYIHN